MSRFWVVMGGALGGRGRPLAPVVLVVGVLGLVACKPAPPPEPLTYRGPKDAVRVAMAGDSIAAVAGKPIASSMATYQVLSRNVASIDLAKGRKQLIAPMVRTKPDILVIELGINSSSEVWDSRDLPHLDGILADVRSVPCVVWVVTSALAPSYYDHLGPGTLQGRIGAFTAALAKRLPKHPNVHLADWTPVQLRHRTWFAGDHLHPNVQGSEALGAFYREQVDSYCGRKPRPR